jgi:RNA polymerase sigma-70 factor
MPTTAMCATCGSGTAASRSMTIAICGEVHGARQVLTASRSAATELECRNVLMRWRLVFQQGKTVWNGVTLEYEEFMAHVQKLGHADVPSHAVELYLTAACRLGRRSALEALDEQFVEQLRVKVRNLVGEPWMVDDVLQEVRSRLLAGPCGKLAFYRGTGPLAGWMRAIALNIAKDHLRDRTSRRRLQAALHFQLRADASEMGVPNDDITPRTLGRERYQACSEAMRKAFESLSPDKRKLLHDHFLRQRSIDVLGAVYLVNRATVARRINRAADDVRRSARRFLAASYPREDARTLDDIALAACRELMIDSAALLALSGNA